MVQITKESEHFLFTSVAVIKIVLFGFTSLLASLTILAHIAQISHLAFKLYALLSLIMVLVVLVGVTIVSRKWSSKANVNDQGVLFSILAIGIMGAILALIIHRPDSDDFSYVPNAIFYIQNPNMKMGFDIHFFHVNGAQVVSPMLHTSTPYEYTQAVVAHYTGIEYLFIYYMLFPALVGFLIPLSFFYALSHFSVESAHNAAGALIAVGVIILLGDTHRTIANLSFARAFQGKMLFFSAGILLFTAFSFDYFKKPTFLFWVPVLVSSISMIGMTTSATVILPCLASVLAIAHLSTSNSLKRSIYPLIFYFLALVYNLAYGLAIRKIALSYAGMNSPLSQGWPTTFIGHLNYFINPKIPLTPIVAVLSTTVSLIFCKKRKELLAWIAASVLLYLNPIVAPYIIKNVTSPSIYWRLFYILPFPLVVGIGASCIMAYLNKVMKGRKFFVAALTGFILLLMLHYPLRRASVFRSSNRVQVGWPKYKVDTNDLQLAKKIILIAPPGAMLAPKNIAGIITMLTSRYPQIGFRDDGIRILMGYCSPSEEAQSRIEALNYAGGDTSHFDSFQKIIMAHPDLQSIVLVSSIWEKVEVQDFLRKNGYTFYQGINRNCILIWKCTVHCHLTDRIQRRMHQTCCNKERWNATYF